MKKWWIGIGAFVGLLVLLDNYFMMENVSKPEPSPDNHFGGITWVDTGDVFSGEPDTALVAYGCKGCLAVACDSEHVLVLLYDFASIPNGMTVTFNPSEKLIRGIYVDRKEITKNGIDKDYCKAAIKGNANNPLLMKCKSGKLSLKYNDGKLDCFLQDADFYFLKQSYHIDRLFVKGIDVSEVPELGYLTYLLVP